MNTRIVPSSRIIISIVAVAAIALQASSVRANPPCNVPQTANVVLTDNLVCNGTNGIVVGASGITIDLHGFVLLGDNTLGTAGVVNDGGFANVKIINGLIVNFSAGIDIHNGSVKNTIRDIDVIATGGDGILVYGGSNQLTIKDTSARVTGNIGINVGSSTGIKIDRVESTKNVIGMHLGAVTSAKLTNVVVSNSSGNGLLVDGTSSAVTISKSSFNSNGDSGILIDDDFVTGTVVKDVIVSGNASDGLSINGADITTVQKLTAAGNGSGVQVFNGAASTHVSQSLLIGNDFGIFVSGSSAAAVLSKLTVTGNLVDGIKTLRTDTLISSTIARGNGEFGINAVPGTQDGGGNKARGNGDTDCAGVACARF